MRPAARTILASLAATLALPHAEAAAQMMRGPIRPQQQQEGARPAPPPALPGLQGRRAPAPIPADPAVSLAPNEALFDAIARGDLPAAREAVARGADVGARNVLGLTPIDSAVDQGRTEIMFYLLSVRGATRGGSGPPLPEAQASGGPPQGAGATARAGAATARRGATEPAAPPSAAGPRTPPQNVPSGPRLWAGDGGAPLPSVGFLGFDVGRPAGGGPAEAEARSAPPRGRGRG
jgi:ankyrin repeat protein